MVVAKDWIIEKLKLLLKLPNATYEWILRIVFDFLPDLLKCTTNEERKAVVKQSVVIPLLTHLIVTFVPIIIRELANAAKYFL